MDNETMLDHEGRISSLETTNKRTQEDISAINKKLDSLLELKDKGMGALGFVGLILGSGILGVIGVIYTFFRDRVHL